MSFETLPGLNRTSRSGFGILKRFCRLHSSRETRNLTLIIQFRFIIFRFISLIELLDVQLFRSALTRSDIYFNSNGSLRLNEMKFDDLLSVSSLRSSCSLISSIDFSANLFTHRQLSAAMEIAGCRRLHLK